MLMQSPHEGKVTSQTAQGEAFDVTFADDGLGNFVVEIDDINIIERLFSLPGYVDVTDRQLSVEERANRQQVQMLARAKKLREQAIIAVIDDGMGGDAARAAGKAVEDAVLAGDGNAEALESGARAAMDAEENKPEAKPKRGGKGARGPQLGESTETPERIPGETSTGHVD